MPKTYLITGTSTGFGRALAIAALERGDKVVLTARRPESVQAKPPSNPSPKRRIHQQALP